MEFIRPKVFNIAGTTLVNDQVDLMLKEIGAEGWTTNATSDGQKLIEIAGKGCYKSFNVDLNANLTRVRENRNEEYIQDGIIAVEHGSVLEHVYESFAMVGVTRVLTHEVVRHRIASFSQESLRFVRLTALRAFFPGVFSDDFLDRINKHLESDGKEPLKINEEGLRKKMTEVFEFLEDTQLEIGEMLQLDNLNSFGDKKKLTSAMRRMAPIGLATSILMTTNLRQWREIIAKRSSRHAEEEIRIVAADIFKCLMAKHPAVFKDGVIEIVDGLEEITFEKRC